MKKFILVLVVVIVLISVAGVIVLGGKSEKPIAKDNESMKQIDISEELSTEEVDKIEEEVTKIQEKTVETKPTEEKETNSSSVKKDTPSPKQEETVKPKETQKVEEKKPEVIPPKEEPKVEEKKPEPDAEYLRLLSQVQYNTYDECMKAGFEIAEKDTVNIAGFSCPYIVYKGQILGYRLEIKYY